MTLGNIAMTKVFGFFGWPCITADILIKTTKMFAKHCEIFVTISISYT